MIKIIKKNNYYYFFENNKEITTTFNNLIRVKDEKVAIALCKYLKLCFKSKSKIKKYFLGILYFSFDLDKEKKTKIIDNIISFLNTDLLCYRAKKNSELDTIQKKLWDPLIDFVEKEYKLSFNTTNGIIPINQKQSNKNKLLKILKKLNRHQLTGFYYITNFSNSNIITLNFLANNINFKNTWKVLNLEESYSLKKWGQDKEANEKLLDKKKYLNEIINFNLLLRNQENLNERNQ